MASGRKNKGSRHRSHRHKQQKPEDSGDSDAEQNLRHGPMPESYRNPNPSPPWAMEPLPPNVEGPPLLKQPDTDNVDRKGSHSASSKRRKETLEDSSSEMDRWDAGAADENLTVAALEASKGNLIMSNDGPDRKESKIEGDWKESRGKGRSTHSTGNSKGSSDYVDTSPRETSLYTTTRDGSTSKTRRDFEPDKSYNNDSIHIDVTKTSEASSKARSSRSSTKDHDYELDDMSPPINSVVTDHEKKRKKNDVAQRSRKSDDTSRPSVSASMEEEEYPISAEKVSEWTLREHTRNMETDKECDSRTRRRQESSKERGGKDRDRDKGSRSNNDQYQYEDRVKDEKIRQEKSKDDSGVKSDRERSSSRHRDDNWKGGRHLDEDSLKPDSSRDRSLKDDKDREQRKKSDRSREDRISEGKQKDDKQKEVLSGKDEFGDARYPEEMYKENRQKENKLKESRYKEDKEPRSKNTVENADEDNFKYEIPAGRDEYSGRYKEDKQPEASYEEDKPKRGRDHTKEDRSKFKERTGKVEEEAENRLDKYRDDALQYVKIKHDKKKGDMEQSSAGKGKEDSRMTDTKSKYEKRNNEHDYNSKSTKGQNEKAWADKQQDGKEMDERDKHERQRGSHEGNGKHSENTSKEDKYVIDKDGKYRDDRTISDRDYRDKYKEVSDRHTKRREGSKERRWSNGPYEEKLKEVDDRQKLDTLEARPRTEKTRSDRKHSDKVKEDRLEEMNVTKEFREFDGEKNKEPGYPTKQSKDLDGQSESTEFRESKVYATNKGDRSSSKDHRVASSQDQDRMFTSENRSKRSRDSDMYDVPAADRDHSRSKVRSTDDFSDMPHEKSSRRNKFEASMSVSSSSGTRRPREQNWHMIDHAEQGKQYLGFDEEVRSWEPRGSNQDSDDERRRPFGHDRARDSRYSLSPRGRGQDEFGKSSESVISKDSTPLKRKQHNFQQSSASTKNRRVDDGSGERERSGQGSQSNRVSEGRSISQNRQGPSALLPPPPPYRPGVDNPAVMGAPNSFGDESNPREGGRYDRKSGSGHLRRSEMGAPGDTWGSFGMGNWNPHNQGPVPGPGNMFSSFPQGAFLGMGQQFHMPQMFGPGVGRPSADMGFGGGRFHMGDGGSAFPGHGPNHGPMMGWHRFPDGSENHRPISGFMDTWDGPGRYPDERQRYGHPDWDQYPQGISRGGWEEPWQGQAGDNKYDINAPHLHRETSYQGRSKDDGSLSDTCVDKVQELDNTMEDLPEETHATDTAGKNHVKTNRRLKERMQMMLVHANISAKLVDEDLYKEYRKVVSSLEKREISEDDYVDPAATFIDEDLEFEVDVEAQELLSNPDEFVPVLPTISDDIFKEILKVYQKPLQQNSIQKSLVGSFLLPESISKLSMTSLGVNPAEETKTGGQECTSESSAGQPVAGCTDIAETEKDTSVKHEDCLNAVNSVEYSQENPAMLDTLDQQKGEDSALGVNNNIESRTNILHVDSISENTNIQMAPVSNDNSSERIEEPLQTELPDNDQLLTNAIEGSDDIPNHVEATQMVGIEYPDDLSHEESGAESNISACDKLGRDAKEAKTDDITDTEGKMRDQDSPETADENTH